MEVTVITNIRRKVLTMLSKMAYDGNLPDHVYDISCRSSTRTLPGPAAASTRNGRS